MENIGRIKSILLIDRFDEDAKRLFTSFKIAEINMPVLVVEDDGFLPDGVMSSYQYFCGGYENVKPGKPRFFDQIDVPPYWEISGTATRARIMDLTHEKASIFYSKSSEKRYVSAVEWLDEKGNVRISEHYNKYGFHYATTAFNKKGERVSKTIFDAYGKEVLVENFVTKALVLKYDGKDIIFKNKVEYILFIIKDMHAQGARIFYNSLSTPFFVVRALPDNGGRDVLFWQEEKRDDIPGNMQVILDGNDKRTKTIYVQKHDSYDALIEKGANQKYLKKLGYVYDYTRVNNGTHNVLICTNSDEIRDLERLIKDFPQFVFHVVAITEMSSKLLAFGVYDNVRLFPGAKSTVIDRLFNECDIYLDINYKNEICDAINRAFLNNQLILGFSDTLHKKGLVAKQNIFLEYEDLSEVLRAICQDEALMDELCFRQRMNAMSEIPNKYKFL